MNIKSYIIAYSFSFLTIAACKKTANRPDAPEKPDPNEVTVTIPGSEPQKNECGPNYQPVFGDNSHILLGIPDEAQPCMLLTEKYLIDQTYYVESYSGSRGTPNWVSWHLSNSDYGNVSREDDFRADPKLPAVPGFYQVQKTSYTGSGFDRGHNCPSGDRTANSAANSSTFLMTNMIPQAPRNNQGPWATMEGFIRSTFTSQGKECYIIMGSYGKGGTGSNGTELTIDNGRVTVPSNIWKIVVVIDQGDNDLFRINENTTIVAVNMPNINTINSNWKQYITTIAEIENSVQVATKNANYNLLSNLPVNIKQALSTKLYK